MNVTQLNKAMLMHMYDINILESRPFSYLDFRDFEVMRKEIFYRSRHFQKQSIEVDKTRNSTFSV